MKKTCYLTADIGSVCIGKSGQRVWLPVDGDGSYTCEILDGPDAEYFKNELQPARKIYHVVGCIEGTNIVYKYDCPTEGVDAPEDIAAELTGEYMIYLDYDKFDDRYPKTIYFVEFCRKRG